MSPLYHVPVSSPFPGILSHAYGFLPNPLVVPFKTLKPQELQIE
jgi:hypothetical protein